MRRIDIKREGCRGFGFVLLLALMIPTVIASSGRDSFYGR